MAFNGRDSTVVASGSYDGLVRLWDVASGECLATIFTEVPGLAAKQSPVAHLVDSRNGDYLLVSTHDSTTRLWKVCENPCLLKRELLGRKCERFCGVWGGVRFLGGRRGAACGFRR